VASSLQVDPAALKAAASQAATVSVDAAAAGVNPCASDVVSAGVAARLSEQMSVAREYTAVANSTAQRFGLLLDGSGAAYEQQEAASTTALGGGIDPAPTPLPVRPPPITKDVAPPWTFWPGDPPSSPREIAKLVHSGSSAPMRAAASGLRADAQRLDAAAGELGSTVSQTRDAWTSHSADLATGRIKELRTWYSDHAEYVRGLATELDSHADHFERARSAIPTPETIENAQRQLEYASEANRRSNGRYSAAVAQAQADVGRLHQAATTGYANYTIATGAITPSAPTPPPESPPAATIDQASTRPAPGDPGTIKQIDRSPSSDPSDPVQGGSDVEKVAAGPVRSAADDPSTATPMPDPVPDPIADDAVTDPVPDPLTGTVAADGAVPAVVGAIMGGLGGGLGGLAGAGQRALGSVGQAGMPALSGLGEPGGPPEGGGGEPSAGGMPETPHVPHAPGGLGGGGNPDPGIGGTEPAGEPGPLAAPAGGGGGLTPAAAAPVTAPAPTTAAAAPAVEPAAGGPGMAGGGMMMPPLMPMGGSRSGSEADKRLYPQRRLRVIAPPNSEPVKGRRERRRPDEKREDEET
jgi:PPE family